MLGRDPAWGKGKPPARTARVLVPRRKPEQRANGPIALTLSMSVRPAQTSGCRVFLSYRDAALVAQGCSDMPLFGAPLSIAGGHHLALLEAQRRGCDTVQIFTKAPSQWSAKPIDDEQAALFRRTLRQTKV